MAVLEINMNRIQQISLDLSSQKLKLQMGIDPRVEISYAKLQDMWMHVQRERKLKQTVSAHQAEIQDLAA